MESTLHRELKSLYAGRGARFEVCVEKYRIDIVQGRRLVEIQHGSLAAVRDKVHRLLESHRVTVVKPIVIRKLLVKCLARGGDVLSRRMSPKRGRLLDVFDDLVHFTQVFPHRRLTLDVPLIDIEEWRYPGHGHRRRWRETDYQVEDQKLIGVRETHRLRRPSDLARLIAWPRALPFDTSHLAESLQVQRWIAQRIAYCFRKMNAIRPVGKRGNALLYDFTHPAWSPRQEPQPVRPAA